MHFVIHNDDMEIKHVDLYFFLTNGQMIALNHNKNIQAREMEKERRLEPKPQQI